MKEYNLKRHYNSNHGSFSASFPVGSEERRRKVQGLLASFERSQAAFSRFCTEQERATIASLRVAWTRARQKRPFTDAETVKECMLAVIDEVVIDQKVKDGVTSAIKKEEDFSASDVSIAMKNESLEIPLPLRRTRSKIAQSTDSDSPDLQPSAKTSKGGRATKKSKTLVGSNSTGNVRGTPATAKRTQSLLAKNNDQTRAIQPKLRSVVSDGDLHCSMPGSAAHITVTTAQGQALSFSEETQEDIDVDLLDDVALCQFQRLTSMMDNLSRRRRCQQ
ncbi:borealin-2 isoform X2 [Pseudochaenichthys georgianus]|uniref:borealin-2 isoform X2 n=1 Tax=Pseudochaenichthys georgianus TaxID=52239 RepID=UPI00146F6E88|nr:borealin-2 isoform X2 [Pseudochaenichthys georgianus]